ncbi:MAG TPA: alanine racemase C-terminal domain-containing protein, partial [Candidatus Gracilibacteria bacterium]|nr:alanine racemase C-terminal domain-containing protein [Candidatus Gracilibacteria bacterium]
KPALEVYSKVISRQEISEGERVSYNALFQTNKATNTATIAFGYYEGLDRRLSNHINFYYKDREFPQIGQICMNLCSLDTGAQSLGIGEEIQVIGSLPEQNNSIENIATQLGTIPYEVLVRLNPQIRRNIVW